jgi:hypothetical protein
MYTLVSINGKGIGEGFHGVDADYSRPGELNALWKAAEKAQTRFDKGWHGHIALATRIIVTHD